MEGASPKDVRTVNTFRHLLSNSSTLSADPSTLEALLGFWNGWKKKKGKKEEENYYEYDAN